MNDFIGAADVGSNIESFGIGERLRQSLRCFSEIFTCVTFIVYDRLISQEMKSLGTSRHFSFWQEPASTTSSQVLAVRECGYCSS